MNTRPIFVVPDPESRANDMRQYRCVDVGNVNKNEDPPPYAAELVGVTISVLVEKALSEYRTLHHVICGKTQSARPITPMSLADPRSMSKLVAVYAVDA
jgi:hypothetical protein